MGKRNLTANGELLLSFGKYLTKCDPILKMGIVENCNIVGSLRRHKFHLLQK